jgi:hypothetical protein
LLPQAGTVIRGNYIGLDVTGTVTIYNGQGGINSSAANVTIGGPAAADGNFVAKWVQPAGAQPDAAGPTVRSSMTSGSTVVQNNVIGMAPDLTTRLNSLAFGVTVQTANNQVLQNIIAGNGTTGKPARRHRPVQLRSRAETSSGATTSATHAGGPDRARQRRVGHQRQQRLRKHHRRRRRCRSKRQSSANSSGAILIVSQRTAQAQQQRHHRQLRRHAAKWNDNHNNADGILLSAAAGAHDQRHDHRRREPGARNLISGNSNGGISMNGSGVSNTVIAGNYIGVAADGLTARGNVGNGIFMNGAHDNTGWRQHRGRREL